VVRSRVPVLIVDDALSFRIAAAQVVDAAHGFVVAGQVGTGEEALAFLRRQAAALVLLDVHMPGMGGVRAAKEITQAFPDASVVLLSIHDRPMSPTLPSQVQFCPKDVFGPDELERLWDRAVDQKE
jgi:DNA-binding NarL/FixJ family response regulator